MTTQTVTTDDGLAVYGEPIRGRSCATCRACCTQVPVELPEGRKPANVRCRHACSRGCSIYASRPNPCRAWSCRWLFDPETADLRRPDLAGYILDPTLDTILLNGEPIDVLQIWVDPARPTAHRDPALRAYLADMAARHGLPAIVRWDSTAGFVLWAPRLTGEADWCEVAGNLVTEDELAAKLAKVGARRSL